jgi:large subunit ribosomal protein L32
MAMPKKRMSHVRSGTRRSQIKLELPQITFCPQCHEPRLAHAVCPSCGTYRGRQVIVQKEKVAAEEPVADVETPKKEKKPAEKSSSEKKSTAKKTVKKTEKDA